ncbi:MAG: DUF3147 family protein [Solirubrobacterales bacterium]|nr:DUF3147 family protein [Solirubrobacterales bacterium]
MAEGARERSLFERLDRRPRLDPGLLAQASTRDLAYRFGAGALTSIAAGVATLLFGARASGILLAFPATLAASLTLIEEQEDSEDAREDARGAVIGGAAMTVFAAVATLTLGHIAGALALTIAAIAWLAGALLGYVTLWWR